MTICLVISISYDKIYLDKPLYFDKMAVAILKMVQP